MDWFQEALLETFASYLLAWLFALLIAFLGDQYEKS